MKRIPLSLLATAVLLTLACCTGHELIDRPASDADSFSAFIEQPVSDTDSRTCLDGSTVYWSTADKVALISGSDTYTYTTAAGDGIFTADNAKIALNQIDAAYYPSSGLSEGGVSVTLPTVQTYVSGSFAPGAYPMISHFNPAEPGVLTFNALCGVMRLNLSFSEDLGQNDVTSIDITAATGISGNFSLSQSGITYSGSSEADKTVTLDCTDSTVKLGQSSTSFYIVLPEGNYEGLKITVNTPLKKRTFTSNKAINVTRSHFTDVTLTVSNLDHRYRIPADGIVSLSYDEAKAKAFTLADLSLLFQFNSFLNFGATGISTAGKSNTFKAVVLEYPTLSGPDNEVVWASGRIYFACNSKGDVLAPDHIVLDSHYTIGPDSECPSEYWTFDAGIALQMGLVVVPDYIGYGSSVNRDHPYLCYDECARNELDMVRAAKSYLKDCGRTVPDKTNFYSIGYSQGGGTALGVLRYIENNDLQSEFNIKRTYCGGGVYRPSLFLTTLFSDPGIVTYPVGLPLMLIGLKATYPTMLGSVESYFTDSFNNAGIINTVKGKQTALDAINRAIYNAVGGNSATSIPAANMLAPAVFNTDGSAYKNLMSALALQDLTDASQWKQGGPKTPVYLFHYALDETVPVVQFDTMKAAGLSNVTYEKANYSTAASLSPQLACHSGYAGIFYARMMSGAYK